MAISSPGVGSNIDVTGIVSKLMAVESKPLTTLQKKEASYQAKLTAYGSLKGALSSFQTAVSGLSDVSKFRTLNATASNATILSASASTTASPGSYAVTVTSLAQSQALSSSSQSSTTTSIGTGASTTLTFQFGAISGGSLASGIYSGAAFTQDANQATGTVVIDSSNNSLQGIRDAINAAGVGVTASIVNDGTSGSPYRLLLTSNSSGESKSMKITTSGGDAAVANLLSYDPAGTQQMSQTTAAQNAALSVNGLAITSASNAVTGAISGVTLNLTAAGTSTVSVSNNTAAVTTAVQGFVQAYNTINTTLNTLTRYNPTTKVAGALFGDTAMQGLQARIRAALGTNLTGVSGNSVTNLSQVGLSFQKDGTLSLDNSKLQSTLTSNFSDFASLFASFGKPTDSLTTYVGSTSNTKAGTYGMEITAIATQGKAVGSSKATQGILIGSAAANLTITGGVNDQLLVAVDGGAPVSVKLTAGVFTDADALAAQVKADVNAALTLAGQSAQVSIFQSGGKLSVTSDAFGSSSGVSIIDDAGGFPGNAGATDLLGSSPTTSTAAIIKAGVNDKLTLGVSGVTTTITLAPGTYTAAALAAQIQSAANGSSAFSSAGLSVSVAQNADVLTVTSSRYGLTSAVSIAGGSAAINLFGNSPVSTIGSDVAGKINGVAALGSGQFLIGATSNASEGLRVQVLGGNTGPRGTINYSTGYASTLNRVLDNILSVTGAIASSSDNINKNIADLQKRATALSVQLDATEKRYTAQFSALDTLIGKMNTTANFLNQQLANLPSMTS